MPRTSTTMNKTCYYASANIAHESIDGEVIIINLINGNYYSLDGTGAEIWELINRSYSIEELAGSKLLPFSIPQLNRYSDMQELLLLDPIHDVDRMGWPTAK